MGQRFQIVVNVEGRLKVYHVHWLWGDYAIRRIGTAVANYLRHNKDGFRSFEDFLKGSFYGKPSDMNSFDRYDNSADYWNDNKWICTSYRHNAKSRNLKKFLATLDNNDGFFYIEVGRGISLRNKGFNGYCFMCSDLRPISAEEYMKDYKITEGFTKKQEKEFARGLKTFEGLSVIEPIKTVKVCD